MIPGIVAGQTEATAPIMPEGSLAYADFINGVYAASGVSQVASYVVDDPSLITPETGLVLGEPDWVLAYLLNEFQTLLTDGSFTLVIEVDVADTDNVAPIIISNPSGTAFHLLVELFDGSAAPSNSVYAWDSVNGGARREVIAGSAWAAGIFRIALTRTSTKLSVSVNGGSVVTNTATRTITGAVTEASLGGGTQFVSGSPWEEIIIRNLTIYDSVDDAELPALST